MIRFRCEQCSHEMSIPDQSAGRRGKCPKCGNNVIVPDKSTTITFKCRNCGLKISVPRTPAGQKGRCPNCKNPITVQAEKSPVPRPEQDGLDDTMRLFGNDPGLTLLDVPEELKQRNEPVYESIVTGANIEHRFDGKAAAKEADVTGRSKLPWIIDIFLYPTSKAGLTTLAIIVLMPLFIGILVKLLGVCSRYFPPLLVFVRLLSVAGFLVCIILFLYLYWYFCECIHDSAAGGVRAPETIAKTPGFGEMFRRWLRAAFCLVAFFGPVLIYYWYSRQTDAVFWILLSCAIIFFPMALLAVVMFGSLYGLNPILLISSILRSFLPYCAMIAAFLSSVVLIAVNLPDIYDSYILAFIFCCVIVYLLIVVAHLLGWFYRRYQDKLKWEV
jgi:DNA-directed RNA polymerase subunit RPC12/RpoP